MRARFFVIVLSLNMLLALVTAVVMSQDSSNGLAQFGTEGKPIPIDPHPLPPPQGTVASYRTVDRWDKTDLTYFFVNCPSRMDCNAAHDAVRRAFQEWVQVAAVSLTETQNRASADIEISWSATNIEDVELGEPGGTLAFAFFPAFGGDVFFDDAEPWTLFDGGETDLFIVAIHEIGHALGLDHSDEQGAIMFPYSIPGLRGLSADDIAGIQRLYGANEGDVLPPVVVDIPQVPGRSDIEVGEGRIDGVSYFEVWTFQAEAGETAQFTMEALDGDLDPYLALLSPDQTEILAEDDDGFNQFDSRIVFTFPQAGQYVIVATRFQQDQGATSGSYQLSAERIGVDTTVAANIPKDDQGAVFRLTIFNQSGRMLCGVWFSPSTQDRWGDNQLLSAGFDRLEDQVSVSWEVPADTYDLLVEDCSGNMLNTFFVVVETDIEAQVLNTELLITQDIVPKEVEGALVDLRIINLSDAVLCGVWFSPTTDANWGANQLALVGFDSLGDGSFVVWKIRPGSYDVLVEDCFGNRMETYGIDVLFDRDIQVFSTEFVVP